MERKTLSHLLKWKDEKQYIGLNGITKYIVHKNDSSFCYNGTLIKQEGDKFFVTGKVLNVNGFYIPDWSFPGYVMRILEAYVAKLVFYPRKLTFTYKKNYMNQPISVINRMGEWFNSKVEYEKAITSLYFIDTVRAGFDEYIKDNGVILKLYADKTR